MKKHSSCGRITAALLAVCMLLSLAACGQKAQPAQTEKSQEGSFENTSGDGGENCVNLTKARSFKAVLPVDKTEKEAQELLEKVTWSMDRDPEKPYVDAKLFPHQSAGGPLTDWKCSDETTPLFTAPKTGVEVVDGQVSLTAEFDSSCYFYRKNWETEEMVEDLSAPHSNGGAYLEDCGYFNLTASAEGTVLGKTPVKIVPYDGFHTMDEIYAELDEMVAFAGEKTDLYVEKISLGKSQGDNGLESLDMPGLIVAKNKQAVDKWQEIRAQAMTDPSALLAKIESGELGDYQVPVLYSNVHANEVAASDGIMKYIWMLLDAAAGDKTLTYNKLTGFTEEGKAKLAEQMGEVGKEGSVAIPDLVKDKATYLGDIRADGMDVSGKVDLEKYYTMEQETVKLEDLMDNIFYLFVPEENVEGRTYVTRTSSGGFDLNRDNSFQTQAETQNMGRLIASWNPVSFVEFHGRIEPFQCEPCDPPHEPNFEYDLLAEHLMYGGEALGAAAVANNQSYNSFVIPQRDYLSYTGEKTADGAYETCWYNPWDDMSTSYTPQFAMLHGTVSYTVELPAYNDDTVNAAAYGQLGQSVYIAANKQSYLTAQTKIFERGVTNANSDSYDMVGQWFCDQYDVEGAEQEIFRPEYKGEGQNGNFYPECYIIPLDGENQKNLQDANDMLEYLARNEVQIQLAKEAFTYNGVEYPAGTAVISMYQAKRSVANGVLYKGTVISDWPVLYSEGITAFNMTRGFDMVTCAEPAAYEKIAAVCEPSKEWNVQSHFTGIEGEKVILANASEDSTAAVNDLLRDKKTVGVILEGENKGSFLCDYADWQTVSAKYLISGEGVALADAPLSAQLEKAPVVYISGKSPEDDKGFVKTGLLSWSYGYNYDRQAMEMLGFTVTENAAEADIVIGADTLDEQGLEAVKAGTPYIAYGYDGANSAAELFEEGQLEWKSASDNAMDALAYVTYPESSLVTASYAAEGDDLLYGYGAGYLDAIPEGSKVLVQMDDSKNLLEGFLPGEGENNGDFLKSVQAIEYHGKGAQDADLNLIVFANTLTNKVHQRDEFNFVSNAAFSTVVGDVLTGSADAAKDTGLLLNAA